MIFLLQFHNPPAIQGASLRPSDPAATFLSQRVMDRAATRKNEKERNEVAAGIATFGRHLEFAHAAMH